MVQSHVTYSTLFTYSFHKVNDASFSASLPAFLLLFRSVSFALLGSDVFSSFFFSHLSYVSPSLTTASMLSRVAERRFCFLSFAPTSYVYPHRRNYTSIAFFSRGCFIFRCFLFKMLFSYSQSLPRDPFLKTFRSIGYL